MLQKGMHQDESSYHTRRNIPCVQRQYAFPLKKSWYVGIVLFTYCCGQVQEHTDLWADVPSKNAATVDICLEECI